MSLATGVRLGPYEIVAPLGSGGMGEVYRARDMRLDRTVALKVLPEILSRDAEFRARFHREARAISQLTHPNICTLYDIGDDAGTTFLVMELLEGETLADRLARSDQPSPRLRRSAGASAEAEDALPEPGDLGRGQPSGRPVAIGEALLIGQQIANALAAAHAKGIVHRDLKPGNIMLTRAGAKLLDFGLAKPSASGAGTVSPQATTPPRPLTVHGTILGTFQYMAPEQLEGAEADPRSDVFAFGCVLYEMLTGQRAFDGKTQASLIAAILEREPTPVATLQPLAPPLLDSIVRKCLAKKPEERWQSAADLSSALSWAADGTALRSTDAQPTKITRRSRLLTGTVSAAAAFAILAVGLLIGRRFLLPAPTPVQAVHFEVPPPPGVSLSPAAVASAPQIAISPNGRLLAYVAARRRTPSQIWIRPIDGRDAQPLTGTEGAAFPFWSPDSRFIAFFAGGKLKKIAVSGGGPQILADAPAGRGGSWSGENIIIFSARPNAGVLRISGSGGPTAEVTHPTGDIIGDNWPSFLPDNRHFLVYHRSTNPQHQGVFLASLDDGQVSPLVANNSMAIFTAGHLVFVREGTLVAVAFDERTLRVSGEEMPIGDHVGYFSGAFGYGAMTAAPDVVAYGPGVAITTSLQWFDRSGQLTGNLAMPGAYTSPRFSPDQRSLALAVVGTTMAERDVWLVDVARAMTSRATFDQDADWFPVWSNDGIRLFFGSTRLGVTSVYQKVGVRPDELVAGLDITKGYATYPNDVSSDGQFLACTQSTEKAYDLSVLRLGATPTLVPFLSTPFNEVQARFSPNARWMAYASDESGGFEVYVRPFPAANQQVKISTAGGTQPEWRHDGKELFYVSADGKMMAVPVATDGPAFETRGSPQALFDVEVPELTAPYPTQYAVTNGGQRFLINTVIDQPSRPALTVMVNWTAMLKK